MIILQWSVLFTFNCLNQSWKILLHGINPIQLENLLLSWSQLKTGESRYFFGRWWWGEFGNLCLQQLNNFIFNDISLDNNYWLRLVSSNCLPKKKSNGKDHNKKELINYVEIFNEVSYYVSHMQKKCGEKYYDTFLYL